MSINFVLIIAGRLASGKSTCSHRVVNAGLAATVVTVSDVLRQLAVSAGKANIDRRALQAMGHKLVEEEPDTLSQLLVGAAPPDTDLVLIDGLRSIRVVEGIKRIVPYVHLVFLDVDTSVRRYRYTRRNSAASDDFDSVDNHPVELMSDQLRAGADLIVDGSQPVERVTEIVVRTCQDFLRSHR